jgi:hypothetical protein
MTADPGRCWWSLGGGPSIGTAYLDYHDQVWGVPERDERTLFEFLTLEGAQAGLSWATILRKRDGYRAAFADFDPEAVAAFDDADIARCLADPGIVRNRAKVNATVANALARTRGSRRISLVVHGRRRGAERLGAPRRCAGRDRSVTNDEQGVATSRFSLRRSDDLLRLHAGDRDGQRPPPGLLSARRVQGTSLTLWQVQQQSSSYCC